MKLDPGFVFLLFRSFCLFGFLAGGSFLALSKLLVTRGLGAAALALPFVGTMGSNLRFCLTVLDRAPNVRSRGDLKDSRRPVEPDGREPRDDRRPLLRLGSPTLNLLVELPA
jgi:hypothetical protein